MNAKSFHLSIQGASHIKKNKECQDASASYFDENCAIAVACDGHGGNDYVRSAVGSIKAAEAALSNIKGFVETVNVEELRKNPIKMLKILEASIINDWNEAVNMHCQENPFTEEELGTISEKAKKRYLADKRIESAYGTTLIAVAMKEEYWFGIHIGDGKCVSVNKNSQFTQPIPWDEKCFLNATTSICDSVALDNFREFFSEEIPVAVFVGSDGIDDSFGSDEQLHNLYKTVTFSFGTSSFDEAVDGLRDYLPRLSAKGSGDDVTIAAVIDLDAVSELDVVKQYDTEKEKARVQENARIEAEKMEAERLRVEEERAQQARKVQQERKPQSRQRFCSNCGARLADAAKFCSECGQKVSQSGRGNYGPQTINVINISPFETSSALENEYKTEAEVSVSEKLASEPSEKETTETIISDELNVEEPQEFIIDDALCDGELFEDTVDDNFLNEVGMQAENLQVKDPISEES